MQNFFNTLDWFMILKSFIVGGIICIIGQVLIDKTKLTPGHITSLFVLIGIILEAFGIYSILIEYLPGGAGMPILNFGYLLANSVKKGVVENGIIGIFKNNDFINGSNYRIKRSYTHRNGIKTKSYRSLFI